MPKVTISPKASINAKDHPAVHVPGLKAGEDLAPCTPAVIKADGQGRFRVYAATSADTTIDGITEPQTVPAGGVVALFGTGMRFHASDAGALTPGRYGLTAVKREVDTAAAGTKFFRAVSKHDLQVISLG